MSVFFTTMEFPKSNGKLENGFPFSNKLIQKPVSTRFKDSFLFANDTRTKSLYLFPENS